MLFFYLLKKCACDYYFCDFVENRHAINIEKNQAFVFCHSYYNLHFEIEINGIAGTRYVPEKYSILTFNTSATLLICFEEEKDYNFIIKYYICSSPNKLESYETEMLLTNWCDFRISNVENLSYGNYDLYITAFGEYQISGYVKTESNYLVYNYTSLNGSSLSLTKDELYNYFNVSAVNTSVIHNFSYYGNGSYQVNISCIYQNFCDNIDEQFSVKYTWSRNSLRGFSSNMAYCNTSSKDISEFEDINITKISEYSFDVDLSYFIFHILSCGCMLILVIVIFYLLCILQQANEEEKEKKSEELLIECMGKPDDKTICQTLF